MLLAVYYSSVANPTTLSLLLCLLLLVFQTSLSTAVVHHNNRRILHHPFFPPSVLSPSKPPSISPRHHHHSNPKLPFSSTTTPPAAPSPTTATPADAGEGEPFFPTFSASPPPPSPPATTTIPTFPANISSLALPTSGNSSASHSSRSGKLIVGLAIMTVSFLALVFFVVFLRRRTRRSSGELRPLYPVDSPTSDGCPPLKLPNTHVSHTSSEFLYLGTVAEHSEFQQVDQPLPSVEGTSEGCHSGRVYHLKLCGGSPELKPLPPLPKHSFHLYSRDQNMFREDCEEEEGVSGTRGQEFFIDEEFFSPSTSSRHGGGDEGCFDNSVLKSSCFSSSYGDSPGRDSDVSVEIQSLAEQKEHFPTPSPPPPPARQWVSSGSGSGLPPLRPPSGPVALKRSGNLSESGERKEEGMMTMKPKLKALYWDKVRASSDRVMVWDQLHPGSFQLNEEMIETLFTANGTTKDGARRSIMPMLNEDYRVLDPKKSQNIAILLKALSVTEKEVCEALLEGNADSLGTELLESLLKMAPTKEEERKLLEYNDQSPMKLGPAEKFLKAMLDVPFAFRRVDAMLYITTFDAEVEYLKKSFETLEVACEQLRNSRLFLKLLEAVLKTGNRMNVGTNRGDAEAFKLDTLLKLVDIKGADGKTTLLHFVVQEIIKAEGTRLSDTNQPPAHDNMEQRKRGLEVVGSLGGELMNVKKAAAMDSDALSMDVTRLARGIIKINEVLRLNDENGMTETNTRFRDSLNSFLKRAEMEIVRIQSLESSAFSRVKELTEYFHGNSAKEEAHPLRIFMVVRDFLGVLDQVCKEVGKIIERTIISSIRPVLSSVNPTLQPPFPKFNVTEGEDTSDSENTT